MLIGNCLGICVLKVILIFGLLFFFNVSKLLKYIILLLFVIVINELVFSFLIFKSLGSVLLFMLFLKYKVIKGLFLL